MSDTEIDTLRKIGRGMRCYRKLANEVDDAERLRVLVKVLLEEVELRNLQIIELGGEPHDAYDPLDVVMQVR